MNEQRKPVIIDIDGRSVAVAAGDNLLAACLSHGIDVPYFCWHGALGSVGACRQCAVRVHAGPDDASGRIVMACTTAAADGQRVCVNDPEAAAFRARVIEWLMVNHPHDCAVCEEAGSCHLQDMTVATGHRTRRHRFDKRTHHNQDLGPLLTHEMNRCIACYRCTRFYRGYAGGRDLDVFGAHDKVYFGRAEDGPLESPFAGNLAEVCPTGVFNDRGWSADYARKWDMQATPSVCPHCAVGCNVLVDQRGGRVRRVQNRYHGAINGHFLCDRGRFGALHTVSGPRLLQHLQGGAPVDEAAAMAAARAALAAGAGAAVGIGSPRASLETNYALQRLVGASRFFAGTSATEAALVQRIAGVLARGPAQSASLADVERCDAVLVLGEDLTGTAPRLALALRQTARGASRALAAAKGVPDWMDEAVRVAGEGRRSPITLVTAAPDALDDIATLALRRDPLAIAAFGLAVADALRGAAGDDADASATAAALAAAQRPLVIAGAGLLAPAIVEAAAAVAAALGERARIVLVPPEVNSLGLALLGGDAAGGGLDGAVALLESGVARTVLVAEADLFERAPRATVERLFAAADTVIVLDALATATSERAELVLPVASFAEAAGTVVNHEGRAQRYFAAVPPAATVAPAAWRRLAALGAGGWATLDALLADLAADHPHLAGAARAAPPAGCKTVVGPVTRTPRPLSGRTADDLAGRVPEAMPPHDPDAALGWGMEGARGVDVTPALITAYTRPGLHSAAAVTRFQQEIGGPLRGGDPGVLLLTPGATPDAAAPAAAVEGDAPGLWLVPLHDPFAGSETSRASALLAARAPAPRLLLHPDDAAAVGLQAGDAVRIDGQRCAAPLGLEAGLARGVVALSSGTLAARGPLRRVQVERVARGEGDAP